MARTGKLVKVCDTDIPAEKYWYVVKKENGFLAIYKFQVDPPKEGSWYYYYKKRKEQKEKEALNQK